MKVIRRVTDWRGRLAKDEEVVLTDLMRREAEAARDKLNSELEVTGLVWHHVRPDYYEPEKVEP